MNSINKPKVETYYILTDVNGELMSYGSISPDQVLDTIWDITEFSLTDFKIELYQRGINEEIINEY